METTTKKSKKVEEQSSSSTTTKKTKATTSLNNTNNNVVDVDINENFNKISKAEATPNTIEIGEKANINIQLSSEEESETERRFIITGNVLGFKNEYYTLLNPEITSNSSDVDRIAFLENLVKFEMLKEIK